LQSLAKAIGPTDDLDDVRMMREAIYKSSRQAFIAVVLHQISEHKVGSDGHCHLFIQLRSGSEQQLSVLSSERDTDQIIQDYQVQG